MRLEINKKVLEETTECLNSFSCLSDERVMCAVKESISNKILFVKNKNKYCRYRLYFGNSVICNCPIRKEIYKQYGK